MITIEDAFCKYWDRIIADHGDLIVKAKVPVEVLKSSSNRGEILVVSGIPYEDKKLKNVKVLFNAEVLNANR